VYQADRQGWDNNGNLIQKTTPTETTLYAWDSNNRLVEVKRGGIAANATTVASYQYDANGNRIGKTTADGKTVAYLIDSNLPYAQVAEEKSTLGTVSDTTTYLYGIERIQMTRAGQGTYYHDDGLGSTRALTDAAGNLTDSYDYDDYGALQSQTGTTKNDFLFAGEQFDVEANLSYNRARYLDTNAGRFASPDTWRGELARPITLNRYIYGDGDPVNRRDPSGRMSLIEAGIAATGIAILSSIAISPGFNQPIGGGSSKSSKLGWLIIASLSKTAVSLVRNEDTRVTLYRAVEDEELADLYEQQAFREAPSGFTVKQFFEQESQAKAIGLKMIIRGRGLLHYHVVSATISQTLFETLNFDAYEGGMGRIVSVYHALLGVFNFDMNRNGGFKYLGTYTN
jgi:RHS repeat-associated protein